VTSEGAILRLGEAIADAVVELLRGLGAETERGPVSVAPKAELALQGLPPMGFVSWSSYLNGGSGGHVLVTGRRAGRKLALLVAGGDASTATDGPLTPAELPAVGEGAAHLLDEAAAPIAALLGEPIELTQSTTEPYETVAEALGHLDLSPRATSVPLTVDGETVRLVHLVPNALLIRMTQTFDDRDSSQIFERLAADDQDASVPAETVREVMVTLRAELGRTRLSLLHASSLAPGAAVTLDRRIDEPVELFVNGRRFGTGELVAEGGRFAVRIAEVTGIGE
jgi:flagellar motor switch protein FliN